MKIAGTQIKSVCAGAMTLALSACFDVPAPNFPAAPAPAAAPLLEASAPAPQVERSDVSLELESFYTRVKNDLRANGLLRTDIAPRDAPFGARQLAENFNAIALNNEYTEVNGRYVLQSSPSSLRRWDVPVRIGLEFGASVSVQKRLEDEVTVSQLTGRLAQASGHKISMSSRPNFHVLVLNDNELRNIAPRLREIDPSISNSAVQVITNLPFTTYCVVVATDPGNRGAYRRAIAVIRAEHPPELRKACFHEEIAQGLGLANDSPRVRPSIFNDDEEFALLTRHDALLLRILYDPRLQPGMAPSVAGPIARQIAYELMGEAL